MSSVDHVVVMGVSGAGKSTVAQGLANRLSRPFADADDFHPMVNVDKMMAGVPLTTADRRPWLAVVQAWMRAREDEGRSSVVACSALRREYRDVLRNVRGSVLFVHLSGDEAALTARLSGRSGHFMPPSLLASQLTDLQPLDLDERGLVLDILESPDLLVERILDALAAPSRSSNPSTGNVTA